MVTLFSVVGKQSFSDTKDKIFYKKPASKWTEAIPIGNGNLGAMVYGGLETDVFKINEETLWSGGPRDLQNHTAINYLPKIRQLLADGKTKMAENLIDSAMLGEWNECYMPMGDLVLSGFDVKDVDYYQRELSFETGVASSEYTSRGITINKQVFASYPDKAIIIKISSNEPGEVAFTVSLSSLLKNSIIIEDNQIILNGNAPKHGFPHFLGEKDPIYEDGEGMRFQMRLQIRKSGGTISQAGDKFVIMSANKVELILTGATSFNGFDKHPVKEGKDCNAICEERLSKINKLNYDQLYSRHIQDFSALYNRVDIDLGSSKSDTLPTNERIENYTPGDDPGLTALYFQYGRYLLISSSRPGKFAQPANLQGIWSNSLQPAWSANWTINCNVQINYWPVEIVNLSECHLPLIELIKEVSVDGAKTAKNMYGCGGWMAHHNIDMWRSTTPVGGSGLWAIYQVGGAWLCHHLWEHYEFTLDKEYLKEVYPLLKGASQFYLDNLIRDKDGFLVNSPSESFENKYKKPDGTIGWVCEGATQDIQIIRDLFQNTREAVSVLDIDTEFGEKIKEYLEQLVPMRISPRTGRLQEWKDDWSAPPSEEGGMQGGQVAQGWGLAVGNQITPRWTPELAEAITKTLEHRKPWEAFNCGSWVGSFAAQFWSRLGNGEKLQLVIDTHLKNAVSPNLTSNFNNFFMIDGNLGFTAAIAEMLIQSHTGEIELLPALPSNYPNGEVKGLCARNGFELDIKWSNHKLEKVIVYSKAGSKCNMRYKDKVLTFDTKMEDKTELNINDFQN